jgi:RNA polymerase sigma-70 factor (ECF subfamily)
MSFPTGTEEQALHERVLRGDALAPPDVLDAFMKPIRAVLCREMGCDPEDAYDSIIDVVLPYLNNPERYDPRKGRLSTYLTQAAKKRVVDRRRTSDARTRRDTDYAEARDVELQARAPNEALEIFVEARLAMERIEQSKLRGEDRALLGLILQGQGSTQELAKVLGLSSLPENERPRAVKRHRDRLMKWLARLGKEEPDVES